jgi:hypothetical protein
MRVFDPVECHRRCNWNSGNHWYGDDEYELRSVDSAPGIWHRPSGRGVLELHSVLWQQHCNCHHICGTGNRRLYNGFGLGIPTLMMSAEITGSGPTRMQDEDVCIAVGEDLTRAYPGYLWMVGCNHEAGTLHIDLQVPKPIGMEAYGYLLYISSVLGPGGQKIVMRAGGELLERFGLRRGSAAQETNHIAADHGLITDGHHNKSKH